MKKVPFPIGQKSFVKMSYVRTKSMSTHFLKFMKVVYFPYFRVLKSVVF